MDGNIEQGLRRFAQGKMSARRRLVVGASATAQDADLGQLYKSKDGVAVHYTALTGTTGAVNDVRSGYDDEIHIASNFTTAVAAADLVTLETNGVTVYSNGPVLGPTGEYVTYRATAALPASATGSIFTVTDDIILIGIIGVVTTVIQTQACNLKITSTPSAGGLSAVDLCANLNVSAAAANSFLQITGTLASALVNSTGAFVFQAANILVPKGTIDLITSATNTGSVKWRAIWKPALPGARVIAF